jgi:hypothetical protein
VIAVTTCAEGGGGVIVAVRGGRGGCSSGRCWRSSAGGSSLPTVAEATRQGLEFVISRPSIQVQAFLHFLNRIEGYADADGGASPKSLVLQCT